MAARHLQDMESSVRSIFQLLLSFVIPAVFSAHPILCLFSGRIYRIEFCPTVCRDPLFLLGRRASVPVGFAEEMRKVRRSHTKSRKGCVQCKNGHVKVGYIA